MPPIPTAPITSELERTSADGATEAAEGAVSKPRAPAPLQLGSGADKLPLLVSSAAELGRHRWNHDDDGDELSVSSSVDCPAQRSLSSLTPRSNSPAKSGSRAPPSLLVDATGAEGAAKSARGAPPDPSIPTVTGGRRPSTNTFAFLSGPPWTTSRHGGVGRGQPPGNRFITKHLLVTGLLVALWYGSSTLLSLYNKWLFGRQYYGFEFPLFVSGLHMVVQFTVASLVLGLKPDLRPNRRPRIWHYCTKVLPCGLATGFDVGLSNSSMKTITLAFYTMCKSSSLIWILLFAFLFRLERPNVRLVGVIFLIFLGVVMMVMDETTFVLIGFIEVMTAAMLSGLRWALTQMLLDRESLGMNNPVATMFFLTPLMASSLLVASECLEGFQNIHRSKFFATGAAAVQTVLYSAAGGGLASIMILSEFCLISRTSVVTLSVGGIVKEVATILISAIVYGDRLSVVNVLGLAISVLGIGLYNYMKLAQLAASTAAAGDEYALLALSESGALMDPVSDNTADEQISVMGSGLVIFDEDDEVAIVEGKPSK